MTDTLTERGLTALLALFDADPTRAAVQYEALRGRLIRFFAWKGVLAAEECADETLDRVARRLAEGEQIRAAEPARYFHGVARNVLREHRAHDERESRHRALWPRDALAPPASDPTAAARCLERCLASLDPESRALALGYYEDTSGGRIASRQATAARLGVTAATLRVRMHRLRLRLEACTARCLGTAPETFGGSRSQGDEGDKDGSGRN